MTSKNMNIGAHFSTEKGLIGAVDACETINGNAIQVFFKSPMNMKTKIKLTEEDAEQTKEAIKESGIFLVTHGSYLLNLCNPVDKSTKWLRDNLIEDLEFADKCGSVGVIIHMGSQNIKIRGKKATISYDEALGNMIANIREILNEFKGDAKIILETCSAEGAKIAKTVEQFCQLYNSFTEIEKRRIGLCVDTCHIFVAGYPINLPSGFHNYFQKFDDLIGLSKITCFHMNDSKAPLASRRDRHENIGKGYIYKDNMYALRMVKHIAKEYSIPMILETHDKNPYSTYRKEIALIRDLDDLDRDIPESYRKNRIIRILSRLEEIHKIKNDGFRAKAYGKGVFIVREFDGTLPDNVKDLKKIKGIGKGLAEKIVEITNTGKLKKLDNLEADKGTLDIIEMHSIAGFGPSTVSKLIKEHKINSLTELRKAYKNGKLKLTNQQELGLIHFDDLHERIPRIEIKTFERELKKIVRKVSKDLNIIITGSYRRKKDTSGDIDVLLSHKNMTKKDEVKNSEVDYIDQILEKLKKKYEHVGTIARGKSKYMGLHRINEKVRHIDFIFMPMESYYSAILYFTGSKELNIKMREMAKSKNYTLNEWGLHKNEDNSRFDVNSEEDIFKLLNMGYIKPERR
jgi:apurinic endonuclease APN1